QTTRPPRVIHDRYLLVRDALSDLVREEASALQHVVGREERADRAEQLHGHPWIEHDRHLLCGERFRAQLFDRPLCRALPDASRVELAEATRSLSVIADLPVAVLGRDRRSHGAAIRLAEGR